MDVKFDSSVYAGEIFALYPCLNHPHLFESRIRVAFESGISPDCCVDGIRDCVCRLLSNVFIHDDSGIDSSKAPLLAHRLSTWSYNRPASGAWDVRYPILGLAIGRGLCSLLDSYTDRLPLNEAVEELEQTLFFTASVVLDRGTTLRDLVAIEIVLSDIYNNLIAIYC